MEQLKPCPFCGKAVADVRTVAEIEFTESDDPNFEWEDSHYSVVCNYNNGGCGAMIGQFYDTPEAAAEAWNRRADAVPAADVRSVGRGEWLSSNGNGHKVGWDDMNPGCPAESCFCSVCGDWLTASDEYPTKGNFCPNCGADMRGAKDE